MTDAEALMWNVEKDPWLNPSGGAISIHDRMPDMDHFRAQLAYTVATVPRLMEHVVGGVGRLSPPVWRPDPEFDLDHHVRVMALPPPGTMRQLLDAVAQIYQDPYDRTRPLWMMYVIGGLEGGRAASIFKIHHAVADGTGAARLSELYIQPTRERARSARRRPRRDAGRRRRGRRPSSTAAHRSSRRFSAPASTSPGARPASPAASPARWRCGVPTRCAPATSWRAPCAPWGSCGRRSPAVAAARRRRPRATRPVLPGGSPLWRNRSRHRHLEVLSFPLEDALAAAKGLGGSLNDWLMTGVVNGAIGYHDARGVPLRTLNTSFVVSTRADKAIGGNSFTPTRFSAPAGPMDPADRFKALSAAMADKRAQVTPGSGTFGGLAGIVNLLPTSVVTSVARSQAAKMDFATSNLRSSKRRFYMSGARVDEAYGFGPLAGTAFNLTSISYAGTFAITMFIDPVAIDEPADLRDHVEAAYHELIDLGTS